MCFPKFALFVVAAVFSNCGNYFCTFIKKKLLYKVFVSVVLKQLLTKLMQYSAYKSFIQIKGNQAGKYL